MGLSSTWLVVVRLRRTFFSHQQFCILKINTKMPIRNEYKNDNCVWGTTGYIRLKISMSGLRCGFYINININLFLKFTIIEGTVNNWTDWTYFLFSWWQSQIVSVMLHLQNSINLYNQYSCNHLYQTHLPINRTQVTSTQGCLIKISTINEDLQSIDV